MKIHVLMVSRVFPAYHPLRGTPTNFHQKILQKEKIHTIRHSYDFWKNRIDEVNEGNALLRVKEWSAKPYHSHQNTLFELTKDSGIGIQKLEFTSLGWFINDIDNDLSTRDLAKNDGLTYHEFLDWFPKTPSHPMALIHFTGFRY